MISVSGQAAQLELRPQQAAILSQMQRFNVLLAHRRFGKTYLAVVTLILAAQRCKWPSPRVHYFSPTYSQSKKIAWDLAKQLTQPFDAKYNESELRIDIGDTRIQLGSAETPDSNRGIYSDFAVLDEPAQMPSAMWTEVLRPALSDRQGGCMMIGTPKGRHGLFYDSYQAAPELDNWWRGMFKASETDIIDAAELIAASRIMTRAEYLQEYECDWSAAIKGAFWSDVMNDIEARGQITRVPHNEREMVWTSWDLGINDATAIWYYQVEGGEYRFIDYEEHTNTGLPDIVKHMQSKPYNYGGFILPHDVKVRSLSTGQSRQQTLHDLGVDVTIAPDVPVIDGIDVARSKIRNCWFDAQACKHGVEALRQYRCDYDDKHGVLRKAPIHDWSSHGADAFRYFAVTRTAFAGDSWRGDPDYSTMDAMTKYG